MFLGSILSLVFSHLQLFPLYFIYSATGHSTAQTLNENLSAIVPITGQHYGGHGIYTASETRCSASRECLDSRIPKRGRPRLVRRAFLWNYSLFADQTPICVHCNTGRTHIVRLSFQESHDASP